MGCQYFVQVFANPHRIGKLNIRQVAAIAASRGHFLHNVCFDTPDCRLLAGAPQLNCERGAPGPSPEYRYRRSFVCRFHPV